MASEAYIVSSAFHSTGKVRNDFHHHNEYELIFVESGTVSVRVGEKQYVARQDDLIMLANLEQHALYQNSSNYHRYWVTLNTMTTDACIHNLELLNLLKNHSESFNHCLNLAPLRSEVIHIFQKIIACNSESLYANDLVSCFISELLIYVCRLHPDIIVRDLNVPCKSLILGVQKYIEQHYREPLRIKELCDLFFISNSYLTHKFKQLSGYSPKKYLTRIRLKHAAIQIQDTTLPICEIAINCGFSDINNFCKQFKQEYGCAPSSLRENIKY